MSSHNSLECNMIGVRHFPNCDFSSDNFPSSKFTNIQFPKLDRPKALGGAASCLALRLIG